MTADIFITGYGIQRKSGQMEKQENKQFTIWDIIHCIHSLFMFRGHGIFSRRITD